jgi:hypothetical protein
MKQQIDAISAGDHVAHQNHQLCFNQTNPCVVSHLLINPIPYIADEAPGDAYFDVLHGEEIWVLIVVELL